ncbi:MAG: hypothetical protein WCV87_03295 [Candidatus Paceibacterota bacterium]|jgi:hypothetical protein
MVDHGTTSNRDLGWYIQFQTDVLSQLPRPGQISEEIARGWHDNREALKNTLRKSLLPPTKAVADSLLELVGTVTVPTSEKFVVVDHFKVDISANAEVKIGYLSDCFKSLFFGKIEEPSGITKLRCQRLRRNSLDKLILDELGDTAEMTLSGVWELLKLQPNGENGVLFASGRTNIFYVCDVNGELKVVSMHREVSEGCWYVFASWIEGQSGCHAGNQVFSRNS